MATQPASIGLLFLALLLSSPTLAADTPGDVRIICAEGEVLVQRLRAPGWIKATSGMALSPGDRIKTKEGRATIEWVDGTRTTIRPGSLYKFIGQESPRPFWDEHHEHPDRSSYPESSRPSSV